MVRRCPQHARGVQQIAIGLERHRNEALCLVGERCADRSGRGVAHALPARAASAWWYSVIGHSRRAQVTRSLTTSDHGSLRIAPHSSALSAPW